MALSGVAALAGGCAVMNEVAGVAHPGHQPDGTYVLLAQENDYDCRALLNEIEQGLKDMDKANSRIDKERSTLPPTVEAAYGRMFGGPDGGLKNAEQFRQTGTRVRALNQQLQIKNCPPVPVEERIAAITAPQAQQPAQVAVAKPQNR